ncbi:MAG: RHS repeat-associated core domain-containing protein [Gemmatimonadetes bacterium]|nr:RHS repeat-associated core domain-containing protein [Gemmatimonadota bacterium]
MARYSYGSAVEEIYFVTDGQGRELAAADFDGSRNQAVWGDGGHREAGTTTNGSSFDATRMGNADQPGVSLFRNRSYDANSGRWLQEDPIGIAGGVNLYQFNGNNPVAYTDPFGLCPKQDLLCQVFVSGAQALGGAAGFFGGLAEGGLEGLACGPAAPACSPALALTNAVAGAIAIGTAAGKAADAIMSGTEPLQMARAGRGGGNSAENRASNQIKKEYRFTPEGENAFHTEIGRLKKFYDVKSLTEEQLREAADIVRQNAKYIRPPE